MTTSLSAQLTVTAPIDLSSYDWRATPGFGGKKARLAAM